MKQYCNDLWGRKRKKKKRLLRLVNKHQINRDREQYTVGDLKFYLCELQIN